MIRLYLRLSAPPVHPVSAAVKETAGRKKIE